MRPAGGRPLGGKRHGSGQQVLVTATLDHLVDYAVPVRLIGRYRIPDRAHFQRFLHACQPWQPLGPVGPWDDAELDFGLTDPSGMQCDPVVTGLRRLQAPPKGSSVNRGHRWLDGIFQTSDDGGQTGPAPLLPRSDLPELLDIGPSDESPTATDENDRVHPLIGCKALHSLKDAFRHAGTERVDWRVLHGNHADSVHDGQLD